LRVDHKTTHKWAWPGSRDPISKFWDLLINGEANEIFLREGEILDAIRLRLQNALNHTPAGDV